MIYSNLPNQINNFSFLGRVNKEVELKVRAPSLGYPPQDGSIDLVGVPFSVGRGGNVETGGKWFLLHY